MPNLIEPSKTAFETLGAMHHLTVIASASSSVLVERYLGDTFLDKEVVSASETKVFGEYRATCQVRLTLLTGTASYTISQQTSRAATATNDSAPPGAIGELKTASLAVGSATSLVTATAKTVTSVLLTPGDWEVTGVVDFLPAATTSVTRLAYGANSTNNALGSDDTYGEDATAAQVPTAIANRKPIPAQRFSLAADTTVYLVARATFTVSTMTAYGTIRARRVR